MNATRSQPSAISAPLRETPSSTWRVKETAAGYFVHDGSATYNAAPYTSQVFADAVADLLNEHPAKNDTASS